MKMNNAVRVSAIAALIGLPGLSLAQEAKKAQAPPAMALPKPGPAHEVLKGEEGTWDATVETFAAGGPPSVTKGVETNTLSCGGLWLLTDFKGETMNQPFQGHGVKGYDLIKKKYVSTWVDSMSAALNIGESTFDQATKTMTGWIEGPDPSGKISKTKAVVQWKSADTRVFTMYVPASPGAPESPMLRITYKRRK